MRVYRHTKQPNEGRWSYEIDGQPSARTYDSQQEAERAGLEHKAHIDRIDRGEFPDRLPRHKRDGAGKPLT